MSRTHEASDIPRRISLSSQAAAYIRTRIEQGAWHEQLPSERRLCEILHVSRPTVRAALHQLGKDGLLDIQQGRRNRLNREHKSSSSIKNHLVGLITSEPLMSFTATIFRGISRMKEGLTEHGFSIMPFVCQHENMVVEQRRLESFLRQNNIFCCVLISVSKEIQQWFSKQQIPALVLGSCHDSVVLPSLDVDYRSVCRHAAGVLLRQKHRHIALVVPNMGKAGDIASEQGFREAMAAYRDARTIVLRYNGTARNITMKLDALFTAPKPPTALLVARPLDAFAVIVYLLKRGISVPGQVSLIVRDPDQRFEFSDPMISHYRFETDVYVNRLSRLVLKLINREKLQTEPQLIFPKYFEGGTVGPPHL